MLNPNVAQVPTVHPRLRGELLRLNMLTLIRSGSSPLTRGTHLWPSPLSRYYRFIPAYAGNSVVPIITLFCSTVHPRLRGELGPLQGSESGIPGSSPLTRGTPIGSALGTGMGRFIPAYAGNSYV